MMCTNNLLFGRDVCAHQLRTGGSASVTRRSCCQIVTYANMILAILTTKRTYILPKESYQVKAVCVAHHASLQEGTGLAGGALVHGGFLDNPILQVGVPCQREYDIRICVLYAEPQRDSIWLQQQQGTG